MQNLNFFQISLDLPPSQHVNFFKSILDLLAMYQQNYLIKCKLWGRPPYLLEKLYILIFVIVWNPFQKSH